MSYVSTVATLSRKNVCVQLLWSAENVALPAFAHATRAAVRRAAVELGGRRDQSISPARRAHSSKAAATACGGRTGQTRRTDGRTPDSCIDLAAYNTMLGGNFCIFFAPSLKADWTAALCVTCNFDRLHRVQKCHLLFSCRAPTKTDQHQWNVTQHKWKSINSAC